MPRYVLVPPVPNGMQFWTIEDKVRNVAAGHVHKNEPNAEQVARDLCARMNAG